MAIIIGLNSQNNPQYIGYIIDLSGAHEIFDKPISLNYQFFKNNEAFNPTSIEFIPNSPYISGNLQGNILIDDQIDFDSFIIKAYDGIESTSARISIIKQEVLEKDEDHRGAYYFYGSTFDDVNGYYTPLEIDGYEHDDWYEKYGYLVQHNLIDATAGKYGYDNEILFNGKCFIFDGGNGCTIVPIGGNETNNWYYTGGGGAGAEWPGDFYNYDETLDEYPHQETWVYNVSPGVLSNPQSSQDWSRHNFPHVEYINN